MMRVQKGVGCNHFENYGSRAPARAAKGPTRTRASGLGHEPAPPPPPTWGDGRLSLGSLPALAHTPLVLLLRGSHLYFHTVLEADHTALERRLLAPGCLRRISASLWSSPGPADTQEKSMMAPIFWKKMDLKKQFYLHGTRNKILVISELFSMFNRSNLFTPFSLNYPFLKIRRVQISEIKL